MFCIYCGKELPEGARFCAFCGKKLEPVPAEHKQAAGGILQQEKVEAEPMEELTLAARAEEDKFAFHWEYYSGENGGKSNWLRDIAEYQGALYQIWEYKRQRNYYAIRVVPEPGGSEKLSCIPIGEDVPGKQIAVNCRGIWLEGGHPYSLTLYSHEGRKISSFKGRPDYIYDDTVFTLEEESPEPFVGWNQLKALVKETNMLRGTERVVWDFDWSREQILEALCGDEKTKWKEEGLFGLTLYGLYANGIRILFGYNITVSIGNDERNQFGIISIDRSSGKWEILLSREALWPHEGEIGIAFFDMLHDTMWWYRNDGNDYESGSSQYTLKEMYCSPIGSIDRLTKSDVKGIWKIPIRWDERMPCYPYEGSGNRQMYFDGEHAYYTTGDYNFYAIDQRGVCSRGWNREGEPHSGKYVDFSVTKNWLWLRLEWLSWNEYDLDTYCCRHQFECPARAEEFLCVREEQVMEAIGEYRQTEGNV